MTEALRRRALSLLARREHTRVELQHKLERHAETDEIVILLDGLQTSGLLSDARYAESYVRTHAARFGVARLRQQLRTRGVDAELVETSLAGIEDGNELERARAVWQRKYGIPPADAREWARHARFLQSRGFGADVIRRLLKDVET